MIENKASLHYEGLSEAYASTITHYFISLNRYAITVNNFHLSGFRDEKLVHSLILSSFLFLPSKVYLTKRSSF